MEPTEKARFGPVPTASARVKALRWYERQHVMFMRGRCVGWRSSITVTDLTNCAPANSQSKT